MNYSLEQLRTAHRNAVAAGDKAAADRIWQARVQAAQSNADKSGANDYGSAASDSAMQNLRAGAGRGLMNVGRHAGNLVGLVGDDSLAESKSLDRDLMATKAGKIGSFIGETAATAPLAGGAVGALGRAGSVGAKIAGNTIARGAAEGALQGFVMGDPGERTASALLGGAVGTLVPAAGKAIGKAAHGLKRTPEAQRLLDAGVDLTPGQMNPGGMLNQAEEAWQSVPGVGAVIKGARDNAQNSFQRVVTQQAAAPGARVAAGQADDMLEQAYRSFEPLYDQAKGFPVRPVIMSASGPDVPLQRAFQQAVASKSVPATSQARNRAAQILQNELSAGSGSSDDLLRMRSNVRAAARKARQSTEALQQDTADLLDIAEQRITAALDSQLPPDAMQAVRTADSQYGLYKTVEDAIARAKDKPGGFTANDLAEAVAQSMGKGGTRGAYARGGGGPLRDLAQAGKETMQMRSPPTGARLAAIGLPAAAGALAPAAGITAGAGLLGMVGTQTGRRLAQGVTPGQRAAQALLNRMEGSVPDYQRELLAQALRRASVTYALPQE